MALNIENISGSLLAINDLGIELAIGQIIDISLDSDPLVIARSANGGDLESLLLAASIEVKDPIDGTTLLSTANGLAAMRSMNETHWRVGAGARAQDVAFNPVTDNSETDVQAAIAENSGKVQWKNVWAEGTYDKHDMVIDGDWTMIANTTTSERAGPQAIGDPDQTPTEDTTFATASDTSVVKMVHNYTVTESGWINSINVRVPNWDLDSVSRVTLVNVTTGESRVIENPILADDAWVTVVNTNVFLTTGDVFEVWFEFYNSTAASSIDGGWLSEIATGVPANASFKINSATVPTTLSIDHDDLDAVDRSSELDGVVANSIITIVETADPSRNIELEVVSVNTVPASYTEYTVSVISLGSKNIRTGRTCTVQIDVPITQPSEYSVNADYYLGVANQPSFGTVVTRLYYDGVQQADVNDAYGIQVVFQEALISDDWDVVATSSNGGGSGGGGGGGGDPDQNLWETITADIGGSAVASTTTDTLTLAGGTGVTTTRSGDTITFDSTVGVGATSKRMQSWTLLSGNLYYNDFAHNLGTDEIAIHIREFSNNEQVEVQYTDILDINTIRTVVNGNSEDLVINVVSGSGPAGPTGPAGAGADITVEDEGTPITTAVTLFDFAGAGVTVTEPVANQVLVTIPGGGSNLTVEDEGTPLSTATTLLNFAGAGVTVTEPVADQMLITIPGGDPDQNLWETISSDSGSTAANTTTDTLTIAGGTGISTAIVGDTLTITAAAVDEDQIIYVGKHGNDSNDGKTIGKAVLTFGQAVTLVTAETPTVESEWAIVCFDGGQYVEDLAIPTSFIILHAPNAHLEGTLTITDDISVTFEHIHETTSGNTVAMTTGTGTSYVALKYLEVEGAANGIVNNGTGILNIEVEFFRFNSSGVGLQNSSITHADIQDWDITGTGPTAVQTTAGTTNLRATNIADRGATTSLGFDCDGGITNVIVSSITMDELLDVESGATLNVTAGAASGTEANAGTSNVLRSAHINDFNNPHQVTVSQDSTPQLGGNLDLNQNNIIFSIPSTDLTTSGRLVSATVDTNATGFGAALYMAADGNFDEADASSATTGPVRALAAESGTGTKLLLLEGFIRDDSWAWTPGGCIYLSATTGALTQTQPSTSGDQVQKVGFAWSADIVYFSPGDYTIVEVA